MLAWFNADAAWASRENARVHAGPGKIGGQELQGNEAVQPRVLGLVDYPHASATKLFDDAVMRNGLADHSKLAVPKRSLHLTKATIWESMRGGLSCDTAPGLSAKLTLPDMEGLPVTRPESPGKHSRLSARILAEEWGEVEGLFIVAGSYRQLRVLAWPAAGSEHQDRRLSTK